MIVMVIGTVHLNSNYSLVVNNLIDVVVVATHMFYAFRAKPVPLYLM